MLDLLHATLEQQLADAGPLSSQEWLLPYFAQLLSVDIRSPDEEGKHKEVANAVHWRQRKGTLKAVESITEAVGQFEAEIHEGWQRVVITPRIGMALPPVQSADTELDLQAEFPAAIAAHPILPAVTVDLRKPSRAVEALKTNPAAKKTNFAGQRLHWRQLNRHGAPCFPNSFEDVSKRTVDLRDFNGRHGLYHHKKMLAFVPPPEGLIPLPPLNVSWADHADSLFEHLIEETLIDGIRVIRNATSRQIVITGTVALAARAYRIENLTFNDELTVANGGSLILDRVIAEKVSVPSLLNEEPVINATDCLFSELTATGHVLLDRCTVRDTAFLSSVSATHCLFNAVSGIQVTGSLKYCGYPIAAPFSDSITIDKSTTTAPAFFSGQSTLSARCVLKPDNADAILFSPLDGLELGGYHSGRSFPVTITGDFTGANALTVSPDATYTLTDLIFSGPLEVNSGAANLKRCACFDITVNTGLMKDALNRAVPALSAIDSIFETVQVANGLARFEYCTVMNTLQCKQLQASDCLFIGAISGSPSPDPQASCIRYSRVPKAGTDSGRTNTTATPEFIRLTSADGLGGKELRIAEFGEAGYGVLDQHSPQTLRFGAEDGGEVGAHHHKYYSLKLEAVQDKLDEFLPVDMEAALMIDRRLWALPPENNNANDGESS